MFRAGSSAHQLNKPRTMKFAREHIKLGGALIGRATELRDDTAGLVGYLRASKTELGDETLTLVEDGALDELSVGFQAVRSKVHPDGLVERVRVNILETAVVLQGAYGRGARVHGIRSQDGAQEDTSGPESADQADAGTDAPTGLDLALARAQADQSRARILIYRGMIR
jgi:HK97 family phage prohead protease